MPTDLPRYRQNIELAKKATEDLIKVYQCLVDAANEALRLLDAGAMAIPEAREHIQTALGLAPQEATTGDPVAEPPPAE